MDQELARRIGARIRELRRERGVGQDGLSDAAGVHRTTLGRVERGEVGLSVEILIRITNALGVTLADFFEPWDSLDRR